MFMVAAFRGPCILEMPAKCAKLLQGERLSIRGIHFARSNFSIFMNTASVFYFYDICKLFCKINVTRKEVGELILLL